MSSWFRVQDGAAAASPRSAPTPRSSGGSSPTRRLILAAAGSLRPFWHDDRQRAESLMCHRRLVSAFAARDAQLAEAVLRRHILGAVAFLEETWPKSR